MQRQDRIDSFVIEIYISYCRLLSLKNHWIRIIEVYAGAGVIKGDSVFCSKLWLQMISISYTHARTQPTKTHRIGCTVLTKSLVFSISRASVNQHTCLYTCRATPLMNFILHSNFSIAVYGTVPSYAYLACTSTVAM